MKIAKIPLIASLVAAVAIAAGIFTYALKDSTPPATSVAQPDASSTLFNASFDDLNGKKQPLSQWRGKVLVVNFWATWCPPCRTEIPEFIKLQDKYGKQGLVFIGIAIDQKDKVQAYSDEMGINYPVLLGEMEAISLSRQVGNRLGGLPYTLIVDRHGKITTSLIGGITEAKLDQLLAPLL